MEHLEPGIYEYQTLRFAHWTKPRRGSVRAKSIRHAKELLRTHGIRFAHVWRRGGAGPVSLFAKWPLKNTGFSRLSPGHLILQSRDLHRFELVTRRSPMRFVGFAFFLLVGAGCFAIWYAVRDSRRGGPFDTFDDAVFTLGGPLASGLFVAIGLFGLLAQLGITCESRPRRLAVWLSLPWGLRCRTVIDCSGATHIRTTVKQYVHPETEGAAAYVDNQFAASVVLATGEEFVFRSSCKRDEVDSLAQTVAGFWNLPCHQDDPASPE